METTAQTTITIETTVKAPVSKVWKIWTSPEHIVKWNSPSPEWHTPKATQDVKPGGKFTFRMEARDGSAGFDFGGVYDVVTPHEYMEYTLGDNRKVKVSFNSNGNETHIIQAFEAETENSIEQQRQGWQAILNNFKEYTESH